MKIIILIVAIYISYRFIFPKNSQNIEGKRGEYIDYEEIDDNEDA